VLSAVAGRPRSAAQNFAVCERYDLVTGGPAAGFAQTDVVDVYAPR
jgi:hypothetical protein